MLLLFLRIMFQSKMIQKTKLKMILCQKIRIKTNLNKKFYKITHKTLYF